MDPSQVVAANFFDAIAAPDVLLPLAMADVMSPRLWRLGRTVAASPDPFEAARRVVDTAFTHLTPERMTEVAGTLSLASERERLGAGIVDRAIDETRQAWVERRHRGLLGADDALESMIDAGVFPAYSYANVDVIHAARRSGGGGAGRPRGLTSCLDEAVLFATLLMTAPDVTDRLDGIVMVASPVHYTVFCWSGDDAWWFWAKNHLFTPASLRARAHDAHGGDVADLLMGVMAAPVDRIISRRGHLDVARGVSSLPGDEVQRTLLALDAFFGLRLPGLDRAMDGLRFTPPSAHDALFDEATRCASADDVRRMVIARAADDGPTAVAANEALLAFRSRDVADLTPYLRAARRGPLVNQLAARLHTVDAAIDAAAGPAGGTALGDVTRLALPDEVLARAVASAPERALLLHVLLEAVQDLPVRTVIEEDDAITRAGDIAVRASDHARVNPALVASAGPAIYHAG
jgi:hypothetical protein